LEVYHYEKRTFRGKRINLGTYKTEEEAVSAWNNFDNGLMVCGKIIKDYLSKETT